MTCGKVRYRDRIGALFALSQIERKGRMGDKQESRAYRCPNCSGWHLTSKKEWKE